MNEAQREVAELLTQNDWNPADAYRRSRSRALLMREYLRRSALWARDLGAEQEWPFFDIANRLNSAVRADKLLVQDVERSLTGRSLWPSVKDSCIYALHWAALVDGRSPDIARFEHPFDPLLTLYSRGGGFTSEHGFLDLDGISVRLLTCAENAEIEPAPLLSPTFLDDLDSSQ
jgi:hypothetical protein